MGHVVHNRAHQRQRKPRTSRCPVELTPPPRSELAAIFAAPSHPAPAVRLPVMKTKTYWVTTGLVCLSMFWGGLGDLLRLDTIAEGMGRLGYPPYVMTIIGVWKVLATLALLAPRYPRLKEWAYAGVIIDLTGAVASHACANELGHMISPLVLAGLALVSWATRPASRVLGTIG